MTYRYGIDLANILHGKQQYENAKITNEINRIKLDDALKQREREVQTASQIRNFIADYDAGDKSVTNKMFQLDPEFTMKFMEFNNKLGEQDRKLLKDTYESIAKNASYIGQGKTLQDKQNRWDNYRKQAPFYIQDKMSEAFDQNLLDIATNEAKTVAQIFANPTALSFGNKDYLYKNGKLISSAFKPNNELLKLKLKTEKDNALSKLRSESLAGNKKSLQELIALDPESGFKLISAMGKLSAERRERAKTNAEEMGKMAASILQLPENERENAYKIVRNQLPSEFQSEVPEQYDQNFLTLTMSKAMAINDILSDPKRIVFGDKERLYKNGEIIETTNKKANKGEIDQSKQLVLNELISRYGNGDTSALADIFKLDPTIANQFAQFNNSISRGKSNVLEDTLKLLEYNSKQSERDNKLKQSTYESIAKAASSINAAQSLQEKQNLWSDFRNNAPKYVKDRMPEKFDPTLLNTAVQQARTVSTLFSNPKSVTVGDEQILYKDGIELDRRIKPKTGNDALSNEDKALLDQLIVRFSGGDNSVISDIFRISPDTATKLVNVDAKIKQEKRNLVEDKRKQVDDLRGRLEDERKRLDGVFKREERDNKLKQSTYESIAKAASSINAAQSLQEKQNLWSDFRNNAPKFVRKRTPEKFDPTLLNIAIQQSQSINDVFANPKSVSLGGEQILYKNGIELDRRIKPKTGNNAVDKDGFTQLSTAQQRMIVSQASNYFPKDDLGNFDQNDQPKIQALATKAMEIYKSKILSNEQINETQAVELAAEEYGFPKQQTLNDMIKNADISMLDFTVE